MSKSNSSFSELLEDGPCEEIVDSAYRIDIRAIEDFWHWMNMADLSHVMMLLNQNLVPPEQARELIRVLLEWEDLSEDELPADPRNGDLYRNREALLEEEAPEASGWLGLGRPRREATTLAFVLCVRNSWLKLAQSLIDLGRAIIDKARSHPDTLMPDYTYFQRAQPTSFGHYLLGFFFPLSRDLDRLAQLFNRLNRSPSAKGSTNGSRLNLDRQYLASLLGMHGCVEHARDAMWQPDLPIDILNVLNCSSTNLARLANDLQILATQEFGFVELSDETSRPSVIMPNKKNPYSLAFVRGVANKISGNYTTVASSQRTTTGQVDNRLFPYQTVTNSIALFRSTVDLLRKTVRTLEVNQEPMAEAVRDSYLAATDLAEFLTTETHIDYQLSHRIVAKAVKLAESKDYPDDGLTYRVIQRAFHEITERKLGLSEEELKPVLDPETAIQARTTQGGASLESFKQLTESATQTLYQKTQWLNKVEENVEQAESALMVQAKQIL